MEEFEYYTMRRSNADTYPMVNESEYSDHTTEYIYDHCDEKIEDPKEMEFVFAKPYLSNPIIGDYFAQPDPIISKKIADVLSSKNIKGIQLIPAIIKSNIGDIYKNYYYIHIFNHIEAMEKENSQYRMVEGSYFIKKFQLDRGVLKNIPLEDRLIFRLTENSEIKIIHKSIVNEIMKTNPAGIAFSKVQDWRF